MFRQEHRADEQTHAIFNDLAAVVGPFTPDDATIRRRTIDALTSLLVNRLILTFGKPGAAAFLQAVSDVVKREAILEETETVGSA